MEEQYVVFRIGSEYYGLGINDVWEIVRWQKTTSLPGAMPCVDGIINLRGNVISVVNLAQRLGMQEDESLGEEQRKLVVVNLGGRVFAVKVDEVDEILRVTEDEVSDTSLQEESISEEFIKGIYKGDEKLVVLLQLDNLFSEQEKAALTKLGGENSAAETAAAP
ncbi:MAG: chemotaxis protein CheW [Synergistales bacterium]|nr:chemotaxis protein CheW [Synergistales bacterium]